MTLAKPHEEASGPYITPYHLTSLCVNVLGPTSINIAFYQNLWLWMKGQTFHNNKTQILAKMHGPPCAEMTPYSFNASISLL